MKKLSALEQFTYKVQGILDRGRQARQEKSVDDYNRAVEARRLMANGQVKDDPRQTNKNYVYQGMLTPSPTAQPIPTARPTATPVPIQTATPKPQRRGFLGLGQVLGTSVSQAAPTATPTPPPPKPVFDFSRYKINSPGFEGKTIPQPPDDIAKVIWQVFGPTNEATPAAAVAWSENGLYNPNAVSRINNDGTVDYGVFQVNSGTFDGLKKRRPQEMAALGIGPNTSYEILKDPRVNAGVAALIRKDEEWSGAQPWSRWYGWQPPPLGKDVNIPEMVRLLEALRKKK